MPKEAKQKVIRLVDIDHTEDVPRIALPSLMLTWITGGGIPRSRITVLSGFEHSGKTTVATLAAIQCANNGEKVIYADVEGTFNASWAYKLGLKQENKRNIRLWHPQTHQEFFDDCIVLMETEKPALIVLDSIHFLQTDEELEKGTSGSNNARHAPVIASGVRKVSNAQRDSSAQTAIIIIDKVYMNINNPFEPLIEWGGGQLKLSSSLSLRMFKAAKVKNQEKSEAGEDKKPELNPDTKFVRILVENTKNKVSQPFRKGDLVLRLIPFVGIDVFNEMRVFGVHYGVFTDKDGSPFKGGKVGNSHMYFQGQKVSESQSGKAGLMQRLESDIEFRKQTYEAIYKAILNDAQMDENLSEIETDELPNVPLEEENEDI